LGHTNGEHRGLNQCALPKSRPEFYVNNIYLIGGAIFLILAAATVIAGYVVSRNK